MIKATLRNTTFCFIIHQTDIPHRTCPQRSPGARATAKDERHVLARSVINGGYHECQKHVFSINGEAAGADVRLQVEEM